MTNRRLLHRAAAAEGAMWRSLYVWARRRPPVPGAQPFGYLGVVKPIMAVFVVLSIVEIPVLDLIIRNVVPWPPARWIALALSVWGLLWMFGFIASMKVHPHLVDEARLRIRLSTWVDATVPWENVESARKSYRSLPSGKSVQVEEDGDRRVLHVVVASQTSVDLKLREPVTLVPGRGPVGEVRLYADDPDGLVAAVRAHARQNSL